MKFAASVLVLCAGCGRVGFDATGTPTGDGAVDQASTDANLTTLLASCELGLTMGETSWAGGLIDHCGSPNPAMPVGGAAPVLDAQRGWVGELVGGSSCVIVPDSPELRGGSALTVSAWVEPTEVTPSSFGVISKRTDFMIDTAYSVFLWADTAGAGTVNHLYVDVDAETERFENPNDEFLDTWRQVTVVFDGARSPAQRIAIYVDGAFRTYAPESSSTIPTPPTPPDVYVGCLPLSGPAQSLVGRIDDVMLWTRALSAAEVDTWYTATR